MWLYSWTNHISVLCMGPTTNTQSYAQYTYMIGREHSHVMLPNHASISRFLLIPLVITKFVATVNFLLFPPLSFLVRRDHKK